MARESACTRNRKGMVTADRNRDRARLEDLEDFFLDIFVCALGVAHSDGRVSTVDHAVGLEQIDVPFERPGEILRRGESETHWSVRRARTVDARVTPLEGDAEKRHLCLGRGDF